MNKRMIRCGLLAFALTLQTSQARWLDVNKGRFQTRDSFEGHKENPQSLHKYTFAHNDPVNGTDPTGREVFYANHVVSPAAPSIMHSKLIIVPRNQAYWRRHVVYGGYFVNQFTDGRLFITLGAGPDDGVHLLAGINRPRDVSEPAFNLRELTLPAEYRDEDDAIRRLLALQEFYQTYADIRYVLLPELGQRQFNSNSYLYSLLSHAGYDLGFRTGGSTHGWGNLIAEDNFGNLSVGRALDRMRGNALPAPQIGVPVFTLP